MMSPGSSVITRDSDRGLQVPGRLRSGTTYSVRSTITDAAGRPASGVERLAGRGFDGEQGLAELLVEVSQEELGQRGHVLPARAQRRHAQLQNVQPVVEVGPEGPVLDLAREEQSDRVALAYAGEELHFGPDYIIPKPFDQRVLLHVAPAVARAATEARHAGPAARWTWTCSFTPASTAAPSAASYPRPSTAALHHRPPTCPEIGDRTRRRWDR